VHAKQAGHVLGCVGRACGGVWCGVAGCGGVWCGVVWCGVVWCVAWRGQAEVLMGLRVAEHTRAHTHTHAHTNTRTHAHKRKQACARTCEPSPEREGASPRLSLLLSAWKPGSP
jgi:hypothetical protein